MNYIDPTGESILGALIGPKVIKDTLLGVGLIISGISAGIRTIKNFYKAYNSPTAKLRRQEEKKRREIEWKQEKKKAQSGEKFEDIMSRFLKDSEERQQDFKKHQEFRSRNRKGF